MSEVYLRCAGCGELVTADSEDGIELAKLAEHVWCDAPEAKDVAEKKLVFQKWSPKSPGDLPSPEGRVTDELGNITLAPDTTTRAVIDTPPKSSLVQWKAEYENTMGNEQREEDRRLLAKAKEEKRGPAAGYKIDKMMADSCDRYFKMKRPVAQRVGFVEVDRDQSRHLFLEAQAALGITEVQWLNTDPLGPQVAKCWGPCFEPVCEGDLMPRYRIACTMVLDKDRSYELNGHPMSPTKREYTIHRVG